MNRSIYFPFKPGLRDWLCQTAGAAAPLGLDAKPLVSDGLQGVASLRVVSGRGGI